MPAVLLPEEKEFFVQLGELLRKARLVARMRQKDLAAKTGLSLGTIRRMENGEGGRASLAAWVSVFASLGLFEAVKEALLEINPDPFGDLKGRKRIKKSSFS